MADNNISAVEHLIVNRAEVVSEGCSACGQNFASDPPGARALSAAVEPDNRIYVFCAPCGDSIMVHLQADAVRKRYEWDWVVPLRGKPFPSLGDH